MTATDEKAMSLLVLGTAQLGMPYGIANKTGQPDQKLANEILRTAWEKGIRTLDTAQVYGESESVIGKFLKSHPDCRFNIITKLPPDTETNSPQDIRSAFRNCQARLGCSPAGLLLHNAQMLKAWDGPLGEALTDLKQQGDTGELGVSLYHPEEFELALGIPEITMIQTPFNVMDQRIVKSGLLEKARETGRRVFFRSSFLQGLLLIRPEALPPQFDFAKDALQLWWDFLDRARLDALGTALKFSLQSAPLADIIVGCETASQLLDITNHFHGAPLNPDHLAAITNLAVDDLRLTNPSQWP